MPDSATRCFIASASSRFKSRPPPKYTALPAAHAANAGSRAVPLPGQEQNRVDILARRQRPIAVHRLDAQLCRRQFRSLPHRVVHAAQLVPITQRAQRRAVPPLPSFS